MDNFLSGLVNFLSDTFPGAVAGGAIAYFMECRFRKKDKKEGESLFSSILYYDLKSIENFVLHERSSVDIRYSQQWQDLISNCSFLTDLQVEHLYNVYDSVYNFDHFFKNRNQILGRTKDNCLKDSNLEEHIKNENFESILQTLKKHIV